MAEPSRGETWAAKVRHEFALMEDGEAMVTECARLMDRIDDLQLVINAEPTMIATSQGKRIHPAITEQRSTITVLQRALASLGLTE